ncbi:MAG TPA: CaiB/BaiF CoA-transferase family protein [Acidimicrobiales bacterium]|jgi:alpha-methylacyl-CoA racemase|nr:CaiB/BaiF CoA-transferase family protein [Acidimicrobiales bacterium]
MAGPLQGFKIIEMAGIGPGPFTAMMLADMGAEVLRVDRPNARVLNPDKDVLNRGRRSIAVDLKHPDGVQTVLRLVEQADALLEGFRPGVMERLGLGPDECLARNPKLVYGRMTGWGQEGPLAHAAGHDINYIAIAGVLNNFKRDGERPVPPNNLVGDFGGGGLLLAFGLVCGLLEASRSGKGQVVDAAMVDGAAVLSTMIHAFVAMGIWQDNPGHNMLDTGAPFYEVYETADGKFMAIGAIEQQFYAELLERSGLKDIELPFQMDRDQWPAMKDQFAALFKRKTRDEWQSILEGTDACAVPVLSMTEAPSHPHNVARQTFIERDGVVQPAPAPRFSRTAAAIASPPPAPGEHTDDALTDWGFTADEVAKLREAGAVSQTEG